MFISFEFWIANEAFEKMATFGLMTNMILYLMKQYNMEMTVASNVLFFWSSATNFMPLVGAIIADSFLGRFYTIGIGSVICLVVIYFFLILFLQCNNLFSVLSCFWGLNFWIDNIFGM